MLILTSSNYFVTSDFVKHLPDKPQNMRLAFIPTAGEVEKGDLKWQADDRQALVEVGFQVTDFTFTGKTQEQVKTLLDTTDFVFVSGGNAFYLLQQMKKSGFSDLIHQYVAKGMIYGGSSAGSVVAGPDITAIKLLDDPSLAPALTNYQGLALVDLVIFPHWGSKDFRQQYENMVTASYKPGKKIILLTDEQYLLVRDSTYSIESII